MILSKYLQDKYSDFMIMDENKISIRFANQAKSKTFQNIINIFDLKSKAVLDMGCSYGEFLVHFGPGSLGITIIQEEADYGRIKNLDIQYGNVESDSFYLGGRKFDIIFANNIFEHLYSPHGFLLKIKNYLKPDGCLILGVPCVPNVKQLIKLAKFRGSMASGHINFFTKFTLENTVKMAGWDIVATRGFHFKNKLIDQLLNPIYPHFYIVAKVNNNFGYSDKRKKELLGYGIE